MKTMKLKSNMNSILIMLVVGFSTMAFSPKLGLDSYEIYLNDKLIMKQYVNQPLNLRTLQLEKTAMEDDQLWIRYTHCTIKKGSGSNRVLLLKDDKGHLLTQWKFANTGTENKPMNVSVAALLKLEKEHKDHQISLYYKSAELPKAEMLAYLR
ncbi:hypothetical protein [Algoriphagus resistens]|uniref:hypothetical protein n=1 Tax=Algoriphagus resistens TaxID=1750590 RepID=UPI000716B8CA|nr:hypothetical protein [Algoriphagus resistens]